MHPFIALFLALFATARAQIPSCNSMIYCDGKLLDTIQRAHLYNDSKTFVDMKMKSTIRDTMKSFDRLVRKKPSKEDIQEFVDNYFEMGDELQEWYPPDYNPKPQFLQRIKRDDIKQFATDLIALWPTLARKVKPDVADYPEKYSLIPVPNGCIVPGGRFREFYYWDSYWIIKTLVLCEMYDTSRGMIENFLSMVQKYGFVPNGGRIYYLDRSQPPFLIMMVEYYFDATKNVDWLREIIGVLDTELTFWLNKRIITVDIRGGTYELAHYGSRSGTPRPESYIEDIETASYFESDADKSKCYTEIKGGAESGWDFTSRWIFDKGCGAGVELAHIQTSRIIAVDLNSYLFKDFSILARFYLLLGNWDRCYFWRKKAADMLVAINKVLWDEEDGIWYDFDMKYLRRRKFFFASNLAPLWLKVFEKHNSHRIEKRVVTYMKKQNVLDYLGGIPSSLTPSGEQWDFPNAWAPCQDIVIHALYWCEDPEAKAMGKALAVKWLESNFGVYKEKGAMYEKYDASTFGREGGGGEYVVQTGFGWTNAVCLELINDFYTYNVTTKKSRV